jgi:protein SCO1/2
MALMYDKVVAECGKVILPMMVTCDPARDNPKVLKEYLSEFHPDFIGLTGAYEKIKETCKAYRVYFSTPSSVKPGEDYLVDHSIYFYLMGEFELDIVGLEWCVLIGNRSRRRFRRGYWTELYG